MNIKELIAQALEGQIDAEGRKALQDFDPDALAAASRRKAEAEAEKLREALKLKETEQLSSAEQMARRIEDLTGKVDALNQAKEQAETAVKQAQRRDALNRLRSTHGIAFVKSVDPEIADAAWDRAFKDIDDPLNAPEAKTRVADFKTRNAALILDTSGTGTGRRESPAAPDATESIEARAAQLRKSRVI